MKKIIALLFIATAARADFSGPAKSWYLVDYQSGQSIAAKTEDDLMVPSSMVKLMTAELAFDALRDGRLKLSDKLVVSRNADYRAPALAGATRICLEEGQTITAEDAITGMIVVSGGDGAIVLAERLAGSEAAFVQQMNTRAKEIGMEYTSFGNASGLPDPDNLSTSRELAMLGAHIMKNYPEYLHFFKVRRFEFINPLSDACRVWAKSHAINYNKLLFIMGGAEGLKTGHTGRGGYGVVAAAKRRDRRLIAVINGMSAKNHDALAAEAKRILEYGFENSFNHPIKSSVDVPVWYGRTARVQSATKEPFVLTFENGTKLDGLRVVALVKNDITAPVAKGQVVGRVAAFLNGREIKSAPLLAAADVGRVRFFGRMFRNLKYLLTGK
ncbi:MAG: D-alanyl-D-alanine carboxypeptidase [Rickettsiales bacterium]|nr:D-alanyl-D-alanine carboxypeptidase [Rickettsiales bacterium]